MSGETCEKCGEPMRIEGERDRRLDDGTVVRTYSWLCTECGYTLLTNRVVRGPDQTNEGRS